ncbi:phage late control D family protein [Klebsiella variicola]|nr:phage late control D family protein [Klebsiella variicola]PXM05494.1 late control protein D [Klebsiella variicola]ROG48008.1 phage late control D family protein [Klebsiella variicola]
MVLGLFVFQLRTVPYQQLQYQRNWRHVTNNRVNRRPTTQFLGPDNDQLTLSGVLMPEVTGGRLSLLALELMAEQGEGLAADRGGGTIYGMYVIENLSQTKTEFFASGEARKIEFSLGLKRVDESLAEVVKEIATRHGLKAAIGKDVAAQVLDHLDQTNESDASFLMKLARQYGAIASVKDSNLLFIRQGQGKTASGKALPVITITRRDGDSHRFSLADRGAYTGGIAHWLHTREPEKKETTKVKRRRKTTKPKEPEAKQGDYLIGTDENVLLLNRTYANRSNAERAAKMNWERLQRGVASFSLQLAEGRADLYTEMPVKVSGFKQPIADANWAITTLTRTVNPDR